MTSLFDLLLIIIAAVLGLIIVFEDAKEKKIKNKWIILGFKSGLFCYLALLIWSILGYARIFSPEFLNFYQFRYFFYVLANSCLSIVIAYLFWHYRIWPAGDAKLFSLFAFLIPLKYYSGGFLPYFPSSALLINIFIPAFAFTLAIAVIETLRHIIGLIRRNELFSIAKKYFQEIKSRPDNPDNLYKAFSFFASSALFFIFLPIFRILVESSLSSMLGGGIFIFAVSYFLQNHFIESISNALKKKIYLFTSAALMMFCFVFSFVYFPDHFIFAFKTVVKISLGFAAILMIIKKMSDFYIKRKEEIGIDSDSIPEKTILSDNMIKSIEDDKNLAIQMGSIHAEGLNKEQITILKQWLSDKNQKSVTAYKTIPFAFWIFIGAAITLILKQSIIHHILAFLQT